MHYHYGLGVGHAYAHCRHDAATAANEPQTPLDGEDNVEDDQDNPGDGLGRNRWRVV
jgi:hypothetical protein